MVIHNKRRSVIFYPVPKKIEEKAESFIPPPDAELPPDPIIKEPEVEMPKLEVKEVEETKPRVEKN